MNKLLTVGLIELLMSAGVANACSSAMVQVGGDRNNTTDVLVARTMDFETEMPFYALFAQVGDKNTSNVNQGTTASKNPASWDSKYNVIGKGMSLNKFVDGINSAGLKVAALFAPGITEYPKYDKNKGVPALSIFDLANYLLETSGSVDEALNNIKDVQIVASSILNIATVPLHYHLVDKNGDSAVIEFIDGKVVINKNAPILTNSPSYKWQVDNYKTISSMLSDRNTDEQTNGIYMNGNGYDGIPGSTTPPSRFVKASYLRSLQPTAKNITEAKYSLMSIFNYAMFVPIGANPAPTLWVTEADLAKGTYTITNFIDYSGKNRFSIVDPSSKFYKNTYNVNDLSNTNNNKISHAVLHSSMVALPVKQPNKDTSANIGLSYLAKYINLPVHLSNEMKNSSLTFATD